MKSGLSAYVGIGAAIVGVTAVGLFFAQQINNQVDQPADSEIGAGIDVSGTDCDGIAAARGAVDTELAERKSTASDVHAAELEAASDSYWEKRRGIDEDRRQCESDAGLADPCKDLFEEAHQLAQDILNGMDANGFDEAKFQKREEVKKQYDECLKNPPEESTTAGMLEQCLGNFNLSNQIALDQRGEEEFAADVKHADTVEAAELQAVDKHRILDAIEKECEDTKYERKYGSLPGTGIPVTDYVGGSSACTGNFPGNDPDLQRQISNLHSQLNKAKAAGKTTGFMGTIQLQEKINELEAEMASGEAKCTTDADCGGPVPVCCNIKEIGRAFCSDGVCSNEKTACLDEEVCAGKPAQCMALVQVIEYQGLLISTSQLRIGSDSEEGCKEQHWHGSATALDGTSVTDPNPDGCGYGTLNEKPAFGVYPPSTEGLGHGTSPGVQGVGGQMELSIPGGGGQIEVRGGMFGN